MAEHAVIVTYRLSGEHFGTVQEWEQVHQLERLLSIAIDEASVVLRFGEATDPTAREMRLDL